MKAIIVEEFGSTDHMKYIEWETPEPASHEVLIQVEKTSVNFADIKGRYGKKGAKTPYIPGLDLAGTVVGTGEGVTKFHPGQRVIAFPSSGSYAEFAVADEQLTFAIPESMDWSTAAGFPVVSFTSYQLLADVGRLQAGETVLIHAAAGGIGTTAIKLAKRLGASQVIGTVSRAEKIKAAYQAGADHVICMESEDFAPVVTEYTGGLGADVILDSISGEVSEKSLSCLAPYGRLVHFGNAGGEAGHFKTSDLHASCRSVLGFSFGTTRKKRPHLLQNTASKVFSLFEEGVLPIEIGNRFPLEQAAAAHDLIESRMSTGKVLLDVR
ncbi:quinone oxidoreductase family protein [Bacillus sp. SJS]|uniref:quinone oxidoreductase family protein n=1 Tax=Bacillus sp. SJS TaxID=1423321 RepID=UPI0004DD4CBC|nr:NADPH:quinone oxidoreductase family protein [Bacillus sp. SJS]KZZ86186.1 quinone oxidoreductase [Bacillus sp. SJS]